MSRISLLFACAVLALSSMPALAQDSALKGDFTGKDGKPAGYAEVTPMGEGLLVRIEAEGLEPGWHGLHIHGAGACADAAEGFKAAGSHAMHDDEKHGYKNGDDIHFGDLPNLWVGADRTGKAEYFLDDARLADLKDKDGSSLMIHAKADDYATQPAGDSGDRVACAVLSTPQ